MTDMQNTVQFFLNDQGDFMPGSQLAFYANGTTNPKTIFSDYAKTTPQTNPVTADAAGRFFDIFLDDGLYTVKLLDAAGNTVWTMNNVEYSPGYTQFNVVDTQVATNTANIATNTANIATNTADIAKFYGGRRNIFGAVTSMAQTANVGTISGITQAGPPVISTTENPHTVNNGSYIYQDNDNSMIEMNDRIHKVTATAAQTITVGADDSTNYTAADASGTVVELSTTDVSITSGEIMDSTFAKVVQNTSAYTKQIDADWSAGDNQGGFPATITAVADTWYPDFWIFDTTNTLSDYGWSDTGEADTAATLLAKATDYSLFRRVGWHYVDAVTGGVPDSFRPYRQDANNPDQFWWLDPFALSLISNSANGVVTAKAPPNTIAIIDVNIDDPTPAADWFLWVGGKDQVMPATVNATTANVVARYTGVATDDTGQTVRLYIPVNANSQFAYKASAADADKDIQFVCVGWIDDRGFQS